MHIGGLFIITINQLTRLFVEFPLKPLEPCMQYLWLNKEHSEPKFKENPQFLF